MKSNTFKTNLKTDKILIGIVILLNIIAIVGIFTRFADIDESMFAAHSYYLNETGVVKSPHFHNADFGWENRLFYYHKLFIWIGALVIKLFGYQLWIFRLTSYAFYLLFSVLLYKYFQLKKLSPTNFWVFQIIFLINSTVFYYAFIFRPEIVVMAFGFLSYYLLEKNKEKGLIYYSIFAGVAAGLAMVTHLNGVIFVVAGTFLLLFRKKIGQAFAFGASGTVASSLYFIDLLSAEKMQAWKNQFFDDLNLTDKKTTPLLKVLDEHMRFFHSEREIIFSLLVIASLWLAFKVYNKQHQNQMIYFALLVLALAFATHGPTTKYMLLYMPFMVIMVGQTTMQLRHLKLYQRIVFLFLSVLFIGYHSYVNFDILSKSYPVVKRNNYLASRLPEKDCLIFAHEGFVFNEIHNYTIQSPCAFNFHCSKYHPDDTPTIEDMFLFLMEGQTKYVIIDRPRESHRLFNQIPYGKLELGSEYFNYEVIDKGKDYIIFARSCEILE